jgi:hypothetical protein
LPVLNSFYTEENIRNNAEPVYLQARTVQPKAALQEPVQIINRMINTVKIYFKNN